MATQDRTVTIAPYFKIQSGKIQDCKALCERFVEKSETEAGCLYYGFTFNGDVVFCSEGYKDAEGVLAHIQNVGALLGEFGKVTELLRFEIHGPESELARMRGPLADLKPQYFTLE